MQELMAKEPKMSTIDFDLGDINHWGHEMTDEVIASYYQWLSEKLQWLREVGYGMLTKDAPNTYLEYRELLELASRLLTHDQTRANRELFIRTLERGVTDLYVHVKDGIKIDDDGPYEFWFHLLDRQIDQNTRTREAWHLNVVSR